MGKVITEASTSVDGYIAKYDNTIGRLFDWLQNGDVEMPSPAADITLHLTPESAEYWRGWTSQVGALVVGRTLFDFVNGWGGRHTFDVPVVVVTHQVPTDWVEAHPGAPFFFVTDGVEAAVERARQLAGALTGFGSAGTIAGQCLELGLLDEVMIELVPVVMGRGRPYFGRLAMQDVPLGDPTICIQGRQVTHLVFPVERATAGSGS